MHEVFGCPGRAYLFQVSNAHQNDRTLSFSDGAFAEGKKSAKWSAVRVWDLPVILTDVAATALLPLVCREPGSAAQANPESIDR